MVVGEAYASLYECDALLLGYEVCRLATEPMSERGLWDEATTYFKTICTQLK